MISSLNPFLVTFQFTPAIILEANSRIIQMTCFEVRCLGRLSCCCHSKFMYLKIKAPPGSKLQFAYWLQNSYSIGHSCRDRFRVYIVATILIVLISFDFFKFLFFRKFVKLNVVSFYRHTKWNPTVWIKTKKMFSKKINVFYSQKIELKVIELRFTILKKRLIYSISLKFYSFNFLYLYIWALFNIFYF